MTIPMNGLMLRRGFANTNDVIKGGIKIKFATGSDNVELPSSAINWYPGHIAKAENELTDYLKKVDVVIEVRDARIPLATSHPMVPVWVESKPLLVAISRIDQISATALAEWKEYFHFDPPYLNANKQADNNGRQKENTKVFFIDGKNGAGMFPLRKQVLLAGTAVNEKRIKKGILPRPVRAAVIGYPNVGKSALINRLLNRKLAKSYNKPGVTRQMQWIRLNQDDTNPEYKGIDLLDSPGIIPARQVSQFEAVKLAICNDIGEASYDRVAVATALLDILRNILSSHTGYVNKRMIEARYRINLEAMTGETILQKVADDMYHGNIISAADKVLGDYRKGFMGKTSLEIAPLDQIVRLGPYQGQKAIARDDKAGEHNELSDEIDSVSFHQSEMELARNGDSLLGIATVPSEATILTETHSIPATKTDFTGVENEVQKRSRFSSRVNLSSGAFDGW